MDAKVIQTEVQMVRDVADIIVVAVVGEIVAGLEMRRWA